MAGLDDIRKQAEEVLNHDKVRDALRSDKAEDGSDRVIDGVEGSLDRATGDRFDSQTDAVRDGVDGRVGTDDDGARHTGTRDRDVDHEGPGDAHR